MVFLCKFMSYEVKMSEVGLFLNFFFHKGRKCIKSTNNSWKFISPVISKRIFNEDEIKMGNQEIIITKIRSRHNSCWMMLCFSFFFFNSLCYLPFLLLILFLGFLDEIIHIYTLVSSFKLIFCNSDENKKKNTFSCDG